MTDWREIRAWSRQEMMKRLPRFDHLKGSDGGLPDSDLPECRRTLYAVIGFQPPKDRPATLDVLPVSVGTDPGLAMQTRKGTGYYNVPSSKVSGTAGTTCMTAP